MNYKKTMIFFYFATAVSATLRTLMMLFTTEAKSGFFKKEFSAFSYGMLFLILASLLLCVFFALKCKRPTAPRFMSKVSGTLSVLLAISIVTEALFLDYSGNAAPWQNTLQSVFGLAAAVIFMWLGLYYFGILPNPKAFLALPAVFYILRVIVVFVTYSGVSTIADNVFELASLCAALIFIMQFAKEQNDIGSEKQSAKTLPTALACAFVILTQSLPVIFITLIGNGDKIHSNRLFFPTCLLLAAFALCTSTLQCVQPPHKPRHSFENGISVQDLIDIDDEQ